jgi:hypothetical protein
MANLRGSSVYEVWMLTNGHRRSPLNVCNVWVSKETWIYRQLGARELWRSVRKRGSRSADLHASDTRHCVTETRSCKHASQRLLTAVIQSAVMINTASLLITLGGGGCLPLQTCSARDPQHVAGHTRVPDQQMKCRGPCFSQLDVLEVKTGEVTS